MFYFEQLFRTALSGIDATSIMPTVLQIANVILLITLLYAAFEAFTRGGDVRGLGISAVKYVVMGLAILNYRPLFRDVNAAFNAFANFIATTSTGGTDVFLTWLSQIKGFWQVNGFSSLWPLVTGGAAAVIGLILILVAYIIYPITYAIFAFFYSLYGSVLYVLGPLVLALLPATGVGQLARTYLLNLIIFHAWGVMYAIFGALIAAVNINSVSAVLANGDFLGGFVGVGNTLLLGIASIFYALCIALIPFLAKRIVQGDLGSTMFSLISAAVTAGATVAAGFAGFAGGMAASRGSQNNDHDDDRRGGGGGGAPSSSSGTAANSSSRAPALPPATLGGVAAHSQTIPASSAPAAPQQPAEPSGSGDPTPPPASVLTPQQSLHNRRRGGQFHGFSYTHAAAWGAGRLAGSALRAFDGRKR